ncbi:hypothetical protein [Micromonospora sp. LHW51205]|nr:hypothetical protein [Micromonospora sp. LHW51205]
MDSFWQQDYPQVRAELRGLSPLPPMAGEPDDGRATRRTNPRSR